MFRLIKKGELYYYQIDRFSKSGLVKHCFSTRRGGVSRGEYESLNLRLNCDDDRENVIKNFDILCGAIGIKREDLVLSKQVHEDNIMVVSKEDRGNGMTRENRFKSADALMTNEAKVPIMIYTADCVPVFFLDTKKRVIALAHSGWKGTAKNIAGKTVMKMRDVFGSAAEDIVCGIGPHIGVCHFEVGEDVAKIFKTLDGGVVREYNNKYHADLGMTVKNQLMKTGVPDGNITLAEDCTFCRDELFYSHRRSAGRRGNLAGIMELI